MRAAPDIKGYARVWQVCVVIRNRAQLGQFFVRLSLPQMIRRVPKGFSPSPPHQISKLYLLPCVNTHAAQSRVEKHLDRRGLLRDCNPSGVWRAENENRPKNLNEICNNFCRNKLFE